ncbi:unnamed protein product, partial [Ectocarpus sp. 8 AP-2014]
MVPEETTAEASEWPSLLSSFTGMLMEGRVLGVFGSNDRAAAAPEGDEGSRPEHSRQVEEEEEGQASRSQGNKPVVSSTPEPAALETDLPELGRLERSMTVDDLLPRREPAPPSGNHMAGNNNRQSDGRVAEKVMAMEARR